MRERGLLLKDRLIRATLADQKTQTRRLVSPLPPDGWNPEVGRYHPTKVDDDGLEYPGDEVFGASDEDAGRICRYGEPGDRLYVKEATMRLTDETVQSLNELGMVTGPMRDGLLYRATAYSPAVETLQKWGHRWTSPLFMRRVDARLWLTVCDVRVERLQSISEQDARAEGVENVRGEWLGPEKKVWRPGDVGVETYTTQYRYATAKEAFMHLWDSINEDRAAWASNPWVWAIGFARGRGGDSLASSLKPSAAPEVVVGDASRKDGA